MQYLHARYNYSYARSSCEACTIKMSEWKKKVEEATAELKVLRSKLPFLRLQFENDPEDGTPNGDAVILVQGRTDQLLYAHKFILVRA